MMEFLQAIEASGFSMWVKESSTAYVAVLALHTIGLAFLVGISGSTAMRILGVARSMPLAPMADFFPLMYVGLCINAVTGSVLLVLYPTKFLVDLTLYIKLCAVTVAVVIIRWLHTHVFAGGVDPETAADSKNVKMLARTMLAAWLFAVVAGRLTAYGVNTKLQTAAAVLVLATVVLLVGYFVGRSLGWIKSSEQGAQQRPSV